VVTGERDEALRSACFLALDLLRERYGTEIPYRGGLDQKFWYEGERVPFFQRMKGIHRAAIQCGDAALAVLTSHKSPYADIETEDGFLYDYRAGSINQADNRALREACFLRVPIVYFRATRPCVVPRRVSLLYRGG
jgi:hypothetical protein